jgi:hypothetical protein
MARRNQPPNQLPEEIRNHPEVVRACREWNVGRLFRVINNLTEEPSKFTVTHIGRLCGLTTSRVVEYMKDVHQVTSVAIVERIADGLHIRGALFGLAPRAWESPAVDVPTPTTGPALAVSPLTKEPSKRDPLASIDHSRQMMDRTMAKATITLAQVENIEHMVGLHARNCVVAPPLEMLGRLIADFDEVRTLAAQIQPPRIHTRLYKAAAQIGALIADEFMVLGDTHRAWAWHNTATIAADETEKRDLQSQVRSLGILIPLYYGDAAEAVGIANEVSTLEGPSSTGRCSPASALAVTLKALALAQLGATDASRAALDASGESFERLDLADRFDSVFGFSERRWRFYRARTLVELGDFENAWAAQDEALILYPNNVVGDPTIIKLDRALCLIRQNEIDEGCQLAADALLDLPLEHRATIFLRYGRKILAAIPEKYSTHRSVSRCRALMTDSIKAIEA